MGLRTPWPPLVSTGVEIMVVLTSVYPKSSRMVRISEPASRRCVCSVRRLLCRDRKASTRRLRRVGCRWPVGGTGGAGRASVAGMPGIAASIGTSEGGRGWSLDLASCTPAEGASQRVSGPYPHPENSNGGRCHVSHLSFLTRSIVTIPVNQAPSTPVPHGAGPSAFWLVQSLACRRFPVDTPSRPAVSRRDTGRLQCAWSRWSQAAPRNNMTGFSPRMKKAIDR